MKLTLPGATAIVNTLVIHAEVNRGEGGEEIANTEMEIVGKLLAVFPECLRFLNLSFFPKDLRMQLEKKIKEGLEIEREIEFVAEEVIELARALYSPLQYLDEDIIDPDATKKNILCWDILEKLVSQFSELQNIDVGYKRPPQSLKDGLNSLREKVEKVKRDLHANRETNFG